MPLSQKQMEYLALAWSCFESEPKIDYEKFRDVAGLASAHSARELMRVTKKKLHAEYGSISDSTRTAASKTAASSPGEPKKSTPRKTATTKKRAASAQHKTAPAADTQADDDAVLGAEDQDAQMLSPPPSKRQRTGSPLAIVKDEPAVDDQHLDDGYLG